MFYAETKPKKSWLNGKVDFQFKQHNSTNTNLHEFFTFQAKTYDPEGEYVAFWLPELQALPNDKRNFPGKSYIKQIVPLKFGNITSIGDKGSASARRTAFKGKQTKGHMR